jgi:hypothetical protein
MDAKGLVALWREGLLALKVLRGKTRGYRHHPQLVRFKNTGSPVGHMSQYLWEVHREAVSRAYNFDSTRLPGRRAGHNPIPETEGQLIYEWGHFLNKIKTRAPVLYRELQPIQVPEHHPLFSIVPGTATELNERSSQ